MTNTGIGGHQATEGRTETWLTPPEVLHALGAFDLDPCAAPSPRPWPTASKHIELPEDGLEVTWAGRVWLNPPYGGKTGLWVQRLAEHGRGTCLIFARTETDTWHRWIWPKATAILFLAGRVTFRHPNGAKAKWTGGAPSALIAYGADDAERLRVSGLQGFFVDLAAVSASAG